MEINLVRKLFILPDTEDEDDYKVVDESLVFATYGEAFKQFKSYCNDLSDEVAEGDLDNYIKDDDLLSVSTFSGKKLMAWISRQNVIE